MGAVAKRLFDQAFNDELLVQIEANPNLRDWSAAGRGRTKSNPAGEDGTWWRLHGPDMVQSWIDWRYDSGWQVWTTPDGDAAIEVEIIAQCEQPEGESIPVKMFIDRVMVVPESKELCIVDLKSGARTPESDLQLAFYRYGILQRYGIDVRLGAYWMARKGTITEPEDLQRYSPDLMEVWFRRFVKARSMEIFLPHPSTKCRACSLRDFCAAFGGSKSHLDPDHPNYKPAGDEVERGLQSPGEPEVRAGTAGDAEHPGEHASGTGHPDPGRDGTTGGADRGPDGGDRAAG